MTVYDMESGCAVMFILALVGILVNALIFVILGGHGHSHHGHSHDHDHGCGHSHGKKKHSSLPGVRLLPCCFCLQYASITPLEDALCNDAIPPDWTGLGSCSMC